MSLLDRVQANETCVVVGCDRQRVPDSKCCRDDLNALWRNELTRQPDGTYLRRRTFAARDLTRLTRSAA